MLSLTDIIGGNGGRKHQSMDRGQNHILNLWGDGSVQAKLEGGLLSLSQLYDITQYTLDDASALTTLPRQRDTTLAKNSTDLPAV